MIIRNCLHILVFCELVAASQYLQTSPCFAELLIAHYFDHSAGGQNKQNEGLHEEKVMKYYD